MKRKYTSTSEDGGLHIVLSQLRPYLSFPTLPPSHQQISASPIYKSLYSARGMIKSEQEMHNQNLVFPLAFSQYTASEDTSSAVDEEEGAAVETSVESIDDGAIEEVNSAVHSNPPLESHQDQDDSDREGGSMSSKSSVEKDEFILVKLTDIRKEVQCPICLGIIRKTRTVMECLHRFCRECIDKSMRLGNNEFPACRTHCASRRSLRDDTNYDSLIAALYPDIDKYEEEELAFHEEDKNRNKKIQASIAEIFRRQSEALARKRSTAKATAAAFMRRSQGAGQNCYLRGRGKAYTRITSPTITDDDDEEDAVVDDAGKDYSSGEEASPDRRPKKCRRVVAHRSSPARLSSNASLGSNANDDVEVNRENFHTSPLRAGNRELSWGKGGARSQTRHGSTNGSNGRFVKAARLAKLTEYLRNLDENESKFDVHVTLLHLDEQAWPLGSPYVCCPATSSIRHIRQFIAIQTSAEVEDIDIFVRKTGCDPVDRSDQAVMVLTESPKELQKLRAEELLIGLLSTYASRCGNLELVYSINVRRER